MDVDTHFALIHSIYILKHFVIAMDTSCVSLYHVHVDSHFELIHSVHILIFSLG